MEGDTSLSFNHLIAEMALKFEISFSPFVQIEHKSPGVRAAAGGLTLCGIALLISAGLTQGSAWEGPGWTSGQRQGAPGRPGPGPRLGSG